MASNQEDVEKSPVSPDSPWIYPVIRGKPDGDDATSEGSNASYVFPAKIQPKPSEIDRISRPSRVPHISYGQPTNTVVWDSESTSFRFKEPLELPPFDAEDEVHEEAVKQIIKMIFNKEMPDELENCGDDKVADDEATKEATDEANDEADDEAEDSLADPRERSRNGRGIGRKGQHWSPSSSRSFDGMTKPTMPMTFAAGVLLRLGNVLEIAAPEYVGPWGRRGVGMTKVATSQIGHLMLYTSSSRCQRAWQLPSAIVKACIHSGVARIGPVAM
ncbi:hypothetical protein IWZ03DRAFT_360546 [Phyllosticta citriasiana]|uniref:Uncharacterized protein n=1 Tax=Phyllosticta citriasiana TaxID=595635 RepID=A0ABR1KJX9_9PEZI